MNNTTFIEEGLLKFNNLREDKLQIITTFNNEIWGNMNPFYAQSEEEKREIKVKDERICKILSTKTSFVLTTPPENTICNLNPPSFKLLTEINKSHNDENIYIPIRSNAVIYKRQKTKSSFIVAPADCPVIIMTDKSRNFVIILHFGFPQYLQRLHQDILNFSETLFELRKNELEIYITPYICKEHYLIGEDKYLKSIDKLGPEINKYFQKEYSEIYGEDRYSFNFDEMIKSEILNLFKSVKVFETGICTYEEVGKGNLFSHKYTTDCREKGLDVKEGNFNVIINI